MAKKLLSVILLVGLIYWIVPYQLALSAYTQVNAPNLWSKSGNYIFPILSSWRVGSSTRNADFGNLNLWTPGSNGLLYLNSSNAATSFASSTASKVLMATGTAPYFSWESGIGYVLTAYHAIFNPADSTTYYWGNLFTGTPSVNTVREQIYIPKAGTIKRIDMRWNYTNGSSATTTVSLVLNQTSTTTLSSTIDWNSSPTVLNATGLSIAVVAGDYIELKYDTPAWTPTNPTAVACSAIIYIE